MIKHFKRILDANSSGGLLLLFYCSIFLLFLSAGVNFSSFNVDLHFYLSEIVCSGPSRSLNCSREFQPLASVFRAPQNGSILLQDYGARYTSATFANFLGLFTDRTDSLPLVVAKIYVVKSLIVAYFLTVAVYLTKQFHYTRRFAIQSVVCMFAFPYSLFGASSEYPAVIATVAMLPILISLQIYGQEKQLTTTFHLLLGINFVIGCAVIVANRFETSLFCGLAVLIHSWQTYRKKLNKHRTFLPLLVFAILFAAFVSQNITLQVWLQNLSQNEAKVLSTETAQTSAVVQVIGDAGFSATALLTFFDNSSRNVMNAVLPGQLPFGILGLVLLILFWAPLVLVMTQKLVLLFKAMTLQKRAFKVITEECLPAVLVLILFVLIPFIARTIWFFQYAAPLLLVFLFATKSLNGSFAPLKSLLKVGIFSNALAYVSVVIQNGSLYLGNTAIESYWIVATGLLLGIVAYVSLNLYYGRSTT